MGDRPKHWLSPKEATNVLAEAQRFEDLPAESAGDRITLEELVSAAEEVGLDPEAVVRAARQLRLEKRQSKEAWLGAPTRFSQFAAILRRLNERDLRALSEILKEHGGSVLGGSPTEGSLLYVTDDGVSIRLAPSEAGTAVELTVDRKADAINAAVGAGTLSFVASIAASAVLGVDGAFELSGLIAAGATGGWLGFRLLLQRNAEKWRRRLEELKSFVTDSADRF